MYQIRPFGATHTFSELAQVRQIQCAKTIGSPFIIFQDKSKYFSVLHVPPTLYCASVQSVQKVVEIMAV